MERRTPPSPWCDLDVLALQVAALAAAVNIDSGKARRLPAITWFDGNNMLVIFGARFQLSFGYAA